MVEIKLSEFKFSWTFKEVIVLKISEKLYIMLYVQIYFLISFLNYGNNLVIGVY